MDNKYGVLSYQEKILQLMKDVDRFCNNYDIKYSLAGGTLLGAIRHKGFIPWDDDADIMLDRCNYEKLLQIISSTSNDFGLIRDKWVVRIEYADDRLSIGQWKPTIDLFVIDNVPNNKAKYIFKVFCIKTLQGMLKDNVHLSDYTGIYKACIWATNIIGKAFTSDVKYKWFTFISQIGNHDNAKHVASFNDLFNLITVKYDGMLMKGFERHTFEDVEFTITNKYDNYLKVQYGEYMTLPPEEKRIPGHLETKDN